MPLSVRSCSSIGRATLSSFSRALEPGFGIQTFSRGSWKPSGRSCSGVREYAMRLITISIAKHTKSATGRATVKPKKRSPSLMRGLPPARGTRSMRTERAGAADGG